MKDGWSSIPSGRPSSASESPTFHLGPANAKTGPFPTSAPVCAPGPSFAAAATCSAQPSLSSHSSGSPPGAGHLSRGAPSATWAAAAPAIAPRKDIPASRAPALAKATTLAGVAGSEATVPAFKRVQDEDLASPCRGLGNSERTRHFLEHLARRKPRPLAAPAPAHHRKPPAAAPRGHCRPRTGGNCAEMKKDAVQSSEYLKKIREQRRVANLRKVANPHIHKGNAGFVKKPLDRARRNLRAPCVCTDTEHLPSNLQAHGASTAQVLEQGSEMKGEMALPMRSDSTLVQTSDEQRKVAELESEVQKLRQRNNRLQHENARTLAWLIGATEFHDLGDVMSDFWESLSFLFDDQNLNRPSCASFAPGFTGTDDPEEHLAPEQKQRAAPNPDPFLAPPAPTRNANLLEAGVAMSLSASQILTPETESGRASEAFLDPTSSNAPICCENMGYGGITDGSGHLPPERNLPHRDLSPGVPAASENAVERGTAIAAPPFDRGNIHAPSSFAANLFQRLREQSPIGPQDISNALDDDDEDEEIPTKDGDDDGENRPDSDDDDNANVLRLLDFSDEGNPGCAKIRDKKALNRPSPHLPCQVEYPLQADRLGVSLARDTELGCHLQMQGTCFCDGFQESDETIGQVGPPQRLTSLIQAPESPRIEEMEEDNWQLRNVRMENEQLHLENQVLQVENERLRQPQMESELLRKENQCKEQAVYALFRALADVMRGADFGKLLSFKE